MRRSFLKRLASLAALGAATAAFSTPRPFHFEALMSAAMKSRKATSAGMLAVARAGKRIVAVGERGIVLLSDDEGESWRQAEVPVSVTLTAVQFVDAKKGWAVGHLGVVLQTQDGGASWSLQLDGLRAAEIVAKAATEETSGPAQRFVDDGPDKPFLDVCFENERDGWIVGAYGLALRTEDGGMSWRSLYERVPNPKGLHLYAICKAEGVLYIAGEQGLLLRTADQGKSFEPIISPSKGTYFGLVDLQRGGLLVYGLRGRAFLSADFGRTWSEADTGTRATLTAGLQLANGNVLLASQAGELLLSRDGGKSFIVRANLSGMPLTALLESGAGKLIGGSLRGVRKFSLSGTAS